MVNLGSKARDVYTGFTGVVTSRVEHLYGCTRVCIEPMELREGKPIDSQWFDEQRVEVIEVTSPRVTDSGSSAGPGGPRPAPVRAPDCG